MKPLNLPPGTLGQAADHSVWVRAPCGMQAYHPREVTVFKHPFTGAVLGYVVPLVALAPDPSNPAGPWRQHCLVWQNDHWEPAAFSGGQA